MSVEIHLVVWILGGSISYLPLETYLGILAFLLQTIHFYFHFHLMVSNLLGQATRNLLPQSKICLLDKAELEFILQYEK